MTDRTTVTEVSNAKLHLKYSCHARRGDQPITIILILIVDL